MADSKNRQYHRFCSLADQLDEAINISMEMQEAEPGAEELTKIVGQLEKVRELLNSYEEARSDWDENYDPIG